MAVIAMQSMALKVNAPQWEGLKSVSKSSFSVKGQEIKAARICAVRASQGGTSADDKRSLAEQPPMFASTAASPPSSGGLLPSVAIGLAFGAAGYALAKMTAKEAPAAAPAPVAEAMNGAAAVIQKRAAPSALATISHYFPNAMQDENFVRAVAKELFNLGFSRDNCIALVNTCRDEVCRPLASFIDVQFGLSFNIAGLGGLINCGKTGLKAAMSHSPEFPCDVDGKPRERYVFFAFPHVSIGETGEVGSLLRRGRGKPSSACGALIAIQKGAKDKNIADDPEDEEFVTLKRKVLSQSICADAGPAGPSLVDVTKGALQVITEDLENLISKTVNPETSDYAVVTGVQIHSGNQIPGEPFKIERTVDYVAPFTMYAVIRGEKYILHCEVDQISAIKSVSANMAVAAAK
eukprot:TRINITY_DN301_c0_g1_i1.p1 TRINITY_DN301_c0_g1~~TRINITY_DN301_c0_g1_i1.p1  ORF type:complete len:407 (-),score=88.03 TRINITY_DN301_c0_g1_i1:1085-2305(-)